MEETVKGVVTELHGTIACARISRHGDCSNCGMCPGDSALVIDARNDAGAALYQRVEIVTQSSGMLKAAFIVFIIPIAMIFLGAAGGDVLYTATHLLQRVPMMMIGAAVLFAGSLWIVRHFDHVLRKNEMPRIVRILN